jgi:hypothetical protein
MAHFAKVEDGIVVNVIVAEQEFIDSLPDKNTWLQTSYNTRGNQHYNPDTGEIDSDVKPPFRGNYAQIGGIYDAEYDVFYANQPYPSWTLNKNTWLWEPPVPRPTDGKWYLWDETNQKWVLLGKTQ